MTTTISSAPRPVLHTERHRLYVWELPVRLSHWLIVFSLLVLSFTGIYIGHPFLIAPGEARTQFVMGTMKAIHFYAAIVFTLAALSRIAWMFLGNRSARWHQFLPVRRERRRNLVEMFLFYSFLGPKRPLPLGHNALAGATYLLVFILYLTMILTGLALWGASAAVDSPLRVFSSLAPLLGGLQTVRWIHHAGMWLLLGFFAHHIWSVVMATLLDHNGIFESIVSGWKYVRTEELPRTPERSDR